MLRVKLTERDLKLLHDLYANVFLSFAQIRQRHFQNCATSTIYNRLAKLIKAQLLHSMGVNLKANYLLTKDVGVIYLITKLGLTRLKDYYPQDLERAQPVPINFTTLYHDLLLTDVSRVLQTQLNARIINSKICLQARSLCEQVPDALMFQHQNKKPWALELELTAKSNQRYREIIANYATTNNYERVLYIVKDEHIKTKIGGIISGHGNLFNSDDDTGKFRFLDLNNLLRPSNREVPCEL